MGHIFVATKASIAQLWKSNRGPSLQEIINKVHKHLFETADYSYSSTLSSISLKWSKWEAYRAERSQVFWLSSAVVTQDLQSPQSAED